MPSSTSASHLSPAELSYLHSSLASHPPIRPDARLATDFRPFSAETGILPNTYGSAHVGFADGREAVVGIRAEVEKTILATDPKLNDDGDGDVDMTGTETGIGSPGQGKANWITLTLTLPGLRDDDKNLVFLEEMLREVLVIPSATGNAKEMGTTASSLQDALVINQKWHWRLYVDVVLISPPESASGNFPLPLLSMAIHLALRDTRIPRLKSEGEEDPVADDDWEASVYLYNRKKAVRYLADGVPAVTLLVMVVGENIIFDPSTTELAVADGVLAVSVGKGNGAEIKLPGLRMLETGARDTMKGVPRAEGGNPWDGVPGVWRPKIGGLKRNVMKKVLKVVADEVAREILDGLDGFLAQDT